MTDYVCRPRMAFCSQDFYSLCKQNENGHEKKKRNVQLHVCFLTVNRRSAFSQHRNFKPVRGTAFTFKFGNGHWAWEDVALYSNNTYISWNPIYSEKEYE